jgi:molybdenum cofactor cytidylyltransferase
MQSESDNIKPFLALLLAAGQGSRLGCLPKSLIRLDQATLIEHQINALLQAGASKILIVTGFFHTEIEAELRRIIPDTGRVQIVRNPTPEKGQQASVLLGLEAISTPTSSLPTLIALVDQPLVTADDYQTCLSEFDHRPSSCSIVYPRVNGHRGNPVVISAETVRDILSSGLACRTYIDNHPQHVHRFVSENEHFVFDLDRPEDVRRFENQTGRHLRLP